MKKGRKDHYPYLDPHAFETCQLVVLCLHTVQELIVVSVHQDICDMSPPVLELAVVEDCLENEKCARWSWAQYS